MWKRVVVGALLGLFLLAGIAHANIDWLMENGPYREGASSIQGAAGMLGAVAGGLIGYITGDGER